MDESTQSRERKCQCRIDCVGVVENVVVEARRFQTRVRGRPVTPLYPGSSVGLTKGKKKKNEQQRTEAENVSYSCVEEQ